MFKEIFPYIISKKFVHIMEVFEDIDMEIDMGLIPDSEEDIDEEDIDDNEDNEDNEDDDPSFVPVGDNDNTSEGEEEKGRGRKRGKGRKRERKEEKEAPALMMNPADVREVFEKFVQESSTTRMTKKGKIVPSRIYLNKTERNAGRAHTKVVLTPIGANIRCHSTDVFQLQGNEVILDTATYPSDSTKDSINIGLRMMGGGHYLQQKKFNYELMRGFYNSNGQFQTAYIATVGNKQLGGAFLRMSVSTGKVLQITENQREIIPYAQRMALNFIACHRFHRWECGLLSLLPREIVQIIARELFVLLK